jgi:hypothetical protein
VTIHTIRKCDSSLKLSIDVTSNAAQFHVHPEQWILCLRVVEFESCRNPFPAHGRVAFLAALFKRASMRIRVASCAAFELHISIARRPAGLIRLVAFFARYLNMGACQPIPCFRMIELLGSLPVTCVVTLRTVVAELTLVRIGVTGQAVWRQSEEGFRQLLVFYERAFCYGDI